MILITSRSYMFFNYILKKQDSSAKFWSWFKKNSPRFSQLNQTEQTTRKRLLIELEYQLKLYDAKLSCEIRGHPNKPLNSLIISASGNVHYFDSVTKLVEAAPQLEQWEIIP